MKTFKKLMIVIIAATTLCGTANSKIVNFGVKAGMNVNKISLSNVKKSLTDPKNSCGWEAGVMAEFNVPVVGLCLDASLMYMRMNNNTNVKITDNNSYIDSKQFGKNFLTLPINIKYKFQIPAVSNIFAPYIFTGPEFDFKLDKNTLKDIQTKTCQIAWNIGLGIQLINHLQIGASYGFGINNIADKVSDDINVNGIKAHNNYWTVTAAWLF